MNRGAIRSVVPFGDVPPGDEAACGSSGSVHSLLNANQSWLEFWLDFRFSLAQLKMQARARNSSVRAPPCPLPFAGRPIFRRLRKP